MTDAVKALFDAVQETVEQIAPSGGTDPTPLSEEDAATLILWTFQVLRDDLVAAGSPPPTPGSTPERLFEVLSDALTESGGSHVLGSDVARARNAVMALLSTQSTTTVLWECETSPFHGAGPGARQSFVHTEKLDVPPGTHVVVTRKADD